MMNGMMISIAWNYRKFCLQSMDIWAIIEDEGNGIRNNREVGVFMKNKGNELFQFIGGLAMLVVGLFILSQKVVVSSGFFGAGIWFGNFHMNNGLIMIPFIIGIVWMFASGGSFLSKVFTGISVLLIIAAIIISTRIYLVHLSLYEWILILVLIFGGAGLLAKVLFVMPAKNRDDKEDRRVIEAKDKMLEIEEEIEQIKREQ